MAIPRPSVLVTMSAWFGDSSAHLQDVSALHELCMDCAWVGHGQGMGGGHGQCMGGAQSNRNDSMVHTNGQFGCDLYNNLYNLYNTI